MSHSDTRPAPSRARAGGHRPTLQEPPGKTVQQRDTDRELIARELHDTFGQYLTVMELELVALIQQDDLPQPIQDRLARMRDLTVAAQHNMADMAWQIRPVTLQGMDLKTACEQLLSEWNGRSNLSFDLHLSLGSQTLSEHVENTLYRVLQEAIINAVKHANATRIGVILQVVAQEAVLVVEDDGEGFKGDGANQTSLGLKGIRERLALVGGRLEIESVRGKGVTIIAAVPL